LVENGVTSFSQIPIARRHEARRLALALLVLLPIPLGAAQAAPTHAIAMHGTPLHGPDFAHFAYVDPQAPKGGRLTLGALGSFDSLNPFIVKGVAARGLRDYVHESLMARGLDEPFALYGLIAESVETPDDRSWVEFVLRPEARFSDGAPVTVDDVLFSHALLRDHGRPNHRAYYAKVTRAWASGPRSVRFDFAADGDREMPLIMGLMPILPRHLIDPGRFEDTSLERLVGSGPYAVEAAEPSRRIVYRRNPDYWGARLAVNRGRFNFDSIAIEYFRDSNALFQAFKKGIVEVRPEDDPARWVGGLDLPALRDGRIVKEEFATGLPASMSALVFNSRRPLFADRRVRQALSLLFDFEWLNRNLYFGAYERTQSYFHGSELASHGRPADAAERALLAPWLSRIDPAILDGSFHQPIGEETGRNRENRRRALALLEAAGYVLISGRLVNAATGTPVAFEFLVVDREEQRLALVYARALRHAGISASVRLVDSAQYQRRRQEFDFDAVQQHWYNSLSPGNEQSFYWGSEAADDPGSRNYAGIRDEAVDATIEALIAARTRQDLVAAARALDRVLLSGQYVIPLFHLPRQWVARWREIQRPERTSLYGYQIDTWWRREAVKPAAQ
jgi:peptide/nickel transport system substrate-binding protein